MGDMNFGAGANAALFQKLQQAAIAFVDATHLKVLPGFGLGQQQQAATTPAGGLSSSVRLPCGHATPRPSFASSLASKSGETACSNRSASSCTLNHSIPKISASIRSIRWWRNRKLAGNSLSGSGQANSSVGIYPHQAVLLQPAHSHGYRRRRDLEPVRERRRNNGFAFALGLENGLKVVLFGNCDHVNHIIRRSVKHS